MYNMIKFREFNGEYITAGMSKQRGIPEVITPVPNLGFVEYNLSIGNYTTVGPAIRISV